jgi:hypothetical protein
VSAEAPGNVLYDNATSQGLTETRLADALARRNCDVVTNRLFQKHRTASDNDKSERDFSELAAHSQRSIVGENLRVTL